LVVNALDDRTEVVKAAELITDVVRADVLKAEDVMAADVHDPDVMGDVVKLLEVI